MSSPHDRGNLSNTIPDKAVNPPIRGNQSFSSLKILNVSSHAVQQVGTGRLPLVSSSVTNLAADLPESYVCWAPPFHASKVSATHWLAWWFSSWTYGTPGSMKWPSEPSWWVAISYYLQGQVTVSVRIFRTADGGWSSSSVFVDIFPR